MENKTKIFIILLLINISIFWIIEYPPLQDYPLYLERIFVLQNYENSTLNLSEFYKINLITTTNLANEIIGLLLSNFLPLKIVGKILISIAIAVFGYGLFKFLEIFHKTGPVPFLSIFFIYSALFMFGFLNYVLALGIMFFALIELFKNGVKNKNKLMILILATYLTHLIAFLIFSLTFIIFLLHKKEKLSNLSVLFPSAILLIFFVFISILPTISDSFVLWGNIQNKLILLLFLFISLGKLTIIPTIIFLALIFFLSFIMIRNHSKLDQNRQIIRSILIIVIVFFFLLPTDTNNWGLVDLRIAPMIPIFFLTFINTKNINKKVLTIFVSVTILAIMLSNFVLMQQTSETIESILKGQKYVENNSKALFVFSECEYCIITTPLWHFNRFYTINKGIIVPQLFTSGPYLLVERRIKLPTPEKLKSSNFSMEEQGKFYDYIILIKDDQKTIEDIKKSGSKIIYQNKIIKIFKNLQNGD